jgi:hypothetical protein
MASTLLLYQFFLTGLISQRIDSGGRQFQAKTIKTKYWQRKASNELNRYQTRIRS